MVRSLSRSSARSRGIRASGWAPLVELDSVDADGVEVDALGVGVGGFDSVAADSDDELSAAGSC